MKEILTQYALLIRKAESLQCFYSIFLCRGCGQWSHLIMISRNVF
uniref:Uncharacterized protein n=1 Tax=Utricularia reniformis TaxID=192314 RepID=A0A1Y0B1X6_9LAMI|nr:hypothetical protein AEK19_MT1245 [Utricularia reniformis]ART31455.1 hypothetical protein AEK19_MT1245 [Utricularia reniformis]